MNAPSEKRHLIAEFEEFKELLRHSGPADPSAEAAPAVHSPQSDDPLDPKAWQEAIEPLMNASPKTEQPLGGEFAAELGTRPRPSAPGTRKPKPAKTSAPPTSLPAPSEGRRRAIYLAAAVAIVLGGAVGVGSVLLKQETEAPETTAAEPDAAPTLPATLDANSETDSSGAVSRDASLLDQPPAADVRPNEPPAAQAGDEARPAADAATALAPPPPPPAEARAPAPAPAPAQPEDPRAVTALPEGALAPAPSAAPPQATLTPAPVAAPDALRPSAPPKAAAAKPNERAKPAQAAKPAKPKPAESAARAKPAPKPEAPVVATPAAPPAPPPAPAPVAPREAPGFMERAVESVTGAVDDLGRMTKGVLP